MRLAPAMRIDAARWEGGELILTTSDPDARRLVYEFKPGEYELRRAGKKRSNDANSYAWELIDKLAAATGLTKTEIYRNTICEIGGVSVQSVVLTAALDDLRRSWCSGHLGWQMEIITPGTEYTTVNLIYGSSAYDTRQMSRLIDALIQDAKALGIETMPPDKLERLMQEWDEASARGRSR